MKIDGSKTVAELIQELKADIAERTAFLRTLERIVVVGDARANSTGAETATPAGTHEPQPAIRKSTPKPKSPSMADTIAEVMRKHGKPVTQAEIKQLLLAEGIGVGRKNLSGWINTAIDRRKDDLFLKLPDGTWVVRDQHHHALPIFDHSEMSPAG